MLYSIAADSPKPMARLSIWTVFCHYGTKVPSHKSGLIMFFQFQIHFYAARTWSLSTSQESHYMYISAEDPIIVSANSHTLGTKPPSGPLQAQTVCE